MRPWTRALPATHTVPLPSAPASALIAAVLPALVLVLVWSGPARAQTFDPDRVSMSITIFEAQVQFPPPSWQRTPSGQDEHAYFRDQQGPVFIFEQIPKGQSFQDWSKMQAVLGVYGARQQGLSFAAFVERSIEQFVTICGRDHFAHDELNKSADRLTVVIYCEDSANAPDRPAMGYGPGVGEIALLAFRRHADTYLKIYHEWRGARFTAADSGTWPVSKATLDEMIRRYRNITVLPWQGPAQ